PDSGLELDTPFVRDLDGAPSPRPGSVDNDRDAVVFLVFSECMRADTGTVLLQPGNLELRVDSPDTTTFDATDFGEDFIDNVIGREEFDADPGRHRNIGFRLVPPVLLTGGVEYQVFLGDDWRDCDDGNAISPDEPFSTWTFNVIDMQRPTMLSSIPVEGATLLDASSITEICLTFDEPMNFDVGSVRLEGGPGRLGEGVADVLTNTICYPVTQSLRDLRTYRLQVDGFQDQSGNQLNRTPYLVDGRLDFETGPDVAPPIVESSLPLEGQVGVNPATRTISITFNERMDRTTGLGGVFFSDGTNTTELSCTDACWDDGAETITYEIDDLIDNLGPHVIDINGGGFTDFSGVALDATPYLGDGVLNFDVGEDVFSPTIVECTPIEGGVDVPFTSDVIQCRFDEPMLTAVETVDVMGTTIAGRSSATISDGVGPAEALAGIWTSGDSVINFRVFGRLRAGFSYSIDFDGFVDKGGNPLDGTVYLGDGVLDFTTNEPSGDTCRDPLTIPLATVLPDGGLQWDIPAREFADNDGTDTCDGDTGSDNGASDDVVIEYVKTTGTLAEGGSLLEIDIEATGSVTTDINWEVRTGECEPPEDDVDDGSQLYCQWETQTGLQALDVPAGTYYIWLAKDTTGMFPGATVTVRETAEYPEGESCNRPWTVDTAVPAAYLAPLLPGDPHIFQIPPVQGRGFDRDRVSGGPGENSCTTNQRGNDAVVEFEASGLSILDIRVTPFDIRSSARDLAVEVQVGCDGASAASTTLFCEDDILRGTRFQIAPPPGPIYIWTSSNVADAPTFGTPNPDQYPGAVITITEIPVSPGESCGAALPVTGPTATVGPFESEESLGIGSCQSGNVTWYSYTPADDVVLVTANAAGPIVLVDQNSGRELACVDDPAADTAAGFVRAGSNLCIGVQNDSPLTELRFAEQPYTGLSGTVTDLNVSRALSPFGTELSWTGDRWMTTAPTSGFLVDSSRVYVFPKAGRTRAVAFDSTFGVTSSTLGFVGQYEGGRLYSMDDATGTASRFFDIWDSVSFPWSVVLQDEAPTGYVNSDNVKSLTIDGSNWLYASNGGLETAFYELPIGRPATPTFVSRTSSVRDVEGIAVGGGFVFVCGPSGAGGGVSRFPISQLTSPTPSLETLASFGVPTAGACPIFLDDPESPTVLYVRSNAPHGLYAIADPASPTPIDLGVIAPVGRTGDVAWVYDRDDNAAYWFETATNSLGRIVRID
ncbi:MAG: Ig-like domain-containing protein, partial [Myxococcota bacterium]